MQAALLEPEVQRANDCGRTPVVPREGPFLFASVGSVSLPPIARAAAPQALSDLFFIHSALETVKLQKAAAKSPLFLYRFSHCSERSLAIVFGAANASYGTLASLAEQVWYSPHVGLQVRCHQPICVVFFQMTYLAWRGHSKLPPPPFF